MPTSTTSRRVLVLAKDVALVKVGGRRMTDDQFNGFANRLELNHDFNSVEEAPTYYVARFCGQKADRLYLAVVENAARYVGYL